MADKQPPEDNNQLNQLIKNLNTFLISIINNHFGHLLTILSFLGIGFSSALLISYYHDYNISLFDTDVCSLSCLIPFILSISILYIISIIILIVLVVALANVSIDWFVKKIDNKKWKNFIKIKNSFSQKTNKEKWKKFIKNLSPQKTNKENWETARKKWKKAEKILIKFIKRGAKSNELVKSVDIVRKKFKLKELEKYIDSFIKTLSFFLLIILFLGFFIHHDCITLAFLLSIGTLFILSLFKVALFIMENKYHSIAYYLFFSIILTFLSIFPIDTGKSIRKDIFSILEIHQEKVKLILYFPHVKDCKSCKDDPFKKLLVLKKEEIIEKLNCKNYEKKRDKLLCEDCKSHTHKKNKKEEFECEKCNDYYDDSLYLCSNVEILSNLGNYYVIRPWEGDKNKKTWNIRLDKKYVVTIFKNNN